MINKIVLDVCFVAFVADSSQDPGGNTQKTGLKRKSPFEEEEEESNDSFKLVSDNEEETKTNKKVTDFDGGFCALLISVYMDLPS